MSIAATERRLFVASVAAILTIPLVAGTIGAFGGLEWMCRLFGVDTHVVLDPSIRNSLRAICWMFVAWVPLVVWALRDLDRRAGALQITFAMAWLAGFARITGWVVDGNPGLPPILFMTLELFAIPAIALWHRSILRRIRT